MIFPQLSEEESFSKITTCSKLTESKWTLFSIVAVELFFRMDWRGGPLGGVEPRGWEWGTGGGRKVAGSWATRLTAIRRSVAWNLERVVRIFGKVRGENDNYIMIILTTNGFYFIHLPYRGSDRATFLLAFRWNRLSLLLFIFVCVFLFVSFYECFSLRQYLSYESSIYDMDQVLLWKQRSNRNNISNQRNTHSYYNTTSTLYFRIVT